MRIIDAARHRGGQVVRHLPAPRTLVAALRRRGPLAAGLGALGAVVAARRARRRSAAPRLPEPGPLAADTAVSVHNAAKGAVIAEVRAAVTPDVVHVTGAARAAVRDAASSGVDLTAAAIGAVDGTSSIAHLVDHDRRDLLELAAVAAHDAATAVGPVAAARVRDVLGSLVPDG